MADELKRRAEDLVRKFKDLGDFHAEIVVAVNEDGSPIGGGGGGGEVSLDAASLAALETIDLGATSLAALESITSTGPLTDAQLRATAVSTEHNAARRGVLTDRSGTIAAGGTAQNAMAANANRKYLLVINPSDATEALSMNFTTAAVNTGQPSILLDPGDSFVMEGDFVSTEAISVNAATTGHAFVAKEG